MASLFLSCTSASATDIDSDTHARSLGRHRVLSTRRPHRPVTRDMIGKPRDFVHSGHIGQDQVSSSMGMKELEQSFARPIGLNAPPSLSSRPSTPAGILKTYDASPNATTKPGSLSRRLSRKPPPAVTNSLVEGSENAPSNAMLIQLKDAPEKGGEDGDAKQDFHSTLSEDDTSDQTQPVNEVFKDQSAAPSIAHNSFTNLELTPSMENIARIGSNISSNDSIINPEYTQSNHRTTDSNATLKNNTAGSHQFEDAVTQTNEKSTTSSTSTPTLKST